MKKYIIRNGFNAVYTPNGYWVADHRHAMLFDTRDEAEAKLADLKKKASLSQRPYMRFDNLIEIDV